MLSFASKEATIACLLNLGFVQVTPNENFFDSPKNCKEFNMPIVQAFIYLSNAGYYCVDLDGGFKAPCVWNGPKADWDKTDTTEEFVKWLDKEFPGWK